MDAETYVAVVALIFSLFASLVSILQDRRFGSLSHEPVLVILYDGDIERYYVRNVGHGPALNVIVVQGAAGVGTVRAPAGARVGLWYNPVIIPAVAAGDRFVLKWLGGSDQFALGATYDGQGTRRGVARYFCYTLDDTQFSYRPGSVPARLMPAHPPHLVRRHWQEDLPLALPDSSPG